jgi:hypothetical protein
LSYDQIGLIVRGKSVRTFLKFLLSAGLLAAGFPFFFRWARAQAEGQIDKMQQGVHGTPGVESPLPAPVIAVGAGIVVGHTALAWLLRLGWWESILSFAAGLGAGLALVAAGFPGRRLGL